MIPFLQDTRLICSSYLTSDYAFAAPSEVSRVPRGSRWWIFQTRTSWTHEHSASVSRELSFKSRRFGVQECSLFFPFVYDLSYEVFMKVRTRCRRGVGAPNLRQRLRHINKAFLLFPLYLTPRRPKCFSRRDVFAQRGVRKLNNKSFFFRQVPEERRRQELLSRCKHQSC